MKWATALLSLVLAACARPPVEPRSSLALPEPDPVLREVTRDAVHTAERQGWTLEHVGEAEFAVANRPTVEAVSIPARSCRAFVVVGASGITGAAAALYLPEGRRLARHLGRGGEPPVVGACATDGPLTVYWHVSVLGSGLVRGLAFSLDRERAAARGFPQPPEFGELTLALRRRGFAPRGDERVLRLAAGERTRFPVSLAAHRCLTLVVRGAPSSLVLLEGDEPVARDGAGGEQAVQLCADDRDRTLIAVLEATESGEARVQRYEADRQTLGGEEGLWLGERSPAVTAAEAPAGARELALGPAEVVELPLADDANGCIPIRVTAGEGSRGVWLGRPTEPKRQVEGCLSGPRARLGSVGGGRVWVVVGEGAEAAPTPRPPARGARR